MWMIVSISSYYKPWHTACTGCITELLEEQKLVEDWFDRDAMTWQGLCNKMKNVFQINLTVSIPVYLKCERIFAFYWKCCCLGHPVLHEHEISLCLSHSQLSCVNPDILVKWDLWFVHCCVIQSNCYAFPYFVFILCLRWFYLSSLPRVMGPLFVM